MSDQFVFITVGIPGSGKSTWAEGFAEAHGCRVHSSDAIRERLYGDASIVGDGRTVFSILYDEMEDDIISGYDVIMDSTALSRNGRIRDVRRFHKLGVKVIAVVMNVPFETCLKRNTERSRVVPEEVMQNMIRTYEEPDETEGFDGIWKI